MGTPMLALKDSHTKMILGNVASNKGVVHYAIGVAKKMIEQLGSDEAILSSDKEPTVLALQEAARMKSDVEIVLEKAPVGHRRAVGLAENAVKNAHGNFRVIKDALESTQSRRMG